MPIDKKFLRRLKKILGAEHVAIQAEDLIAYSYDGSLSLPILPDAVVHPGSREEVADVVAAAAGEGIPIVARGAGTGLSGGSLAARGGVVLHFDRMNGVKDLDRGDQVAVVDPGVINWTLKRHAAAAGLFYPPDPGSMKVCTLGGNVAENAGGPYGIKYGTTADYVLGLEAVLSSGEVINTGGRTFRNVTGYDLTRLLVGSEGTLAVITEITLRLLPQPPARNAALFEFDSVEAAAAAVVAIGDEGVIPAAVEMMDHTAIECAEQYRRGNLPTGAAAVLLIEADGDPGGVAMQMQTIASACDSTGGRIVKNAVGDEETEELWDARRSISAALGRMGPHKMGEDICVPRSRVPDLVARIKEIADRRGLTVAIFGHAGEGNLHPNILFDKRDQQMMKNAEGAVKDLFAATIDLGGTLSSEHGIGLAKAPYMKYAVSAGTLRAMQNIKRALDPAGIMNPGKIFPASPTGSER